MSVIIIVTLIAVFLAASDAQSTYLKEAPKCEYEAFRISSNGEEDTVNLGKSSDCQNKHIHSPGRWELRILRLLSQKHNWTLEEVYLRCNRGRNDISFLASSNTKMRIKCEAPYPLDVQFQPVPPAGDPRRLPYSGMAIRFSFQNVSLKVTHYVNVEFPKIANIEDEALDNYNGYFTILSPDFGEGNSQTMSLNVRTMRSTPSKVEPQELTLDAASQQVVCSSSKLHNNHEVYFASVGGDNPSESKFQELCLKDPARTCGNKELGISCVHDRYCKKMFANANHHGIWYCRRGTRAIQKHFFTGLDIELHDVPKDSSTIVNSRFLIQLYEDDENSIKDINSEFPSSSEAGEIPESERFENRPHPPITVRIGEKHKFECHFVSYLLIQPIEWTAQFSNGIVETRFDDGSNTRLEFRNSEGENEGLPFQVPVSSSHIEIEIKPGMTSIHCSAFYWNSNKQASSSRLLDVNQ